MDPSLYSESESRLHRDLLNEQVKRRRVAVQTSHMITIDVEKMSFIVNGSVDVERVFKALREVLGDVVIMHGREMETGISVTGQSIYGWYFETWDGAAEEEAGDAHAG